MDLLGVAGGWISVAGLALDMAGVGILAYDLFPEYRLYKAGRALESARKSIVEFQADRDRADALRKEPPSDELAAARREHAHFVAKSALMLTRAHLLEAASHLRATVPAVPSKEFGDPAMRAEKEIEAIESLRASRLREERKYRPPIGLAVSLIIGGFSLQIVGVIPW